MPGESDGDLLARAGTAVAFEITSRAIFAFGLIALVSAREGDIMIQPYPLTATPGLDPAPDVPTAEEIGQAERLRRALEALYLNRPAFRSAGAISYSKGVPPEPPAKSGT
ncbi:MAG: hypothetical protein IPQ15_08190 [Betaproteobacteria bacterium]|nr:hypothetical protein [Betaproteobacteria bacterium]